MILIFHKIVVTCYKMLFKTISIFNITFPHAMLQTSCLKKKPLDQYLKNSLNKYDLLPFKWFFMINSIKFYKW